MKKILSIAVAFMLTIGLIPVLGVSATLADKTKNVLGASSRGSIVRLGFSPALRSPVEGFADQADMLDDRNIFDFGKIILGKDTQTLIIPIKEENFDYGADTYNSTNFVKIEKDVNQYVMDTTRLEFFYKGKWNLVPDPAVFVGEYSKEPYRQGRQAQYTLTAQKIGIVDMQVKMVFLDPSNKNITIAESKPYRMQGQYLDPTINKHIVDIVPRPLSHVFGSVKLNDEIINANVLSSLEIFPGDVIRFYVDTDSFVWDPKIDAMATGVRKASLDNDKISVIKTVANGNDIIESVGFVNYDGWAEATVQFKSSFDKTKSRDFEFEIALAQNYRRKEETKVTLSGSFGNDVYDVYEDNDYVFLGDGMVAEAINSVRNIRFDLGEGVVINANLSAGQRYYGRASSSVDANARSIMNYFVSIRKTITLKTVGVSSRTNFVTLVEQEQNYYVYDDEGKYLGRSRDKLVYRDRYYLSTKEIEFAEGLEEMPSDEGELEPEPEYGENPNTGSSSIGLPSLLNVLGLLALASGFFVLSKKEDKRN